jgi:uncharacterized protein (UPF0548 family)
MMFSFRRPTRNVIARFLEAVSEAPLSYSPLGISREPVGGYNHDLLREPVGRGEAAFAVARLTLDNWGAFPKGWVEVFPKDSPVVPQSTVAVLARHLGFWSLNGCRVVERWDSSQSKFGFAYGTLTSHAESGEERFIVSLDPDDGTVWYEIRATSRPQAVMARLGYPVSRLVQARFRADSALALREAISAGVEQGDGAGKVRDG